MSKLVSWLVALVACGLLADQARAAVDDYDITISSPSAASSKRSQLIQFIWGSAGFPITASALVDNNIANPIDDPLENLERVEELRTSMPKAMGGEVIVTAYHFIPVRKRHRLVVVHQGHGCPATFGGQFHRTINALLRDGYGVVGVFMPLMSPGQCVSPPDDAPPGWVHDLVFTLAPSGRSAISFFLEPTARSLNYIAQNYPSYQDFNMLGLSGGGWTTAVYAAIDPRIKVSIPVAGSIPLYLRKAGYNHDVEQYHDAFYGVAGYLDLYILGSYGPGRQQIQVFNGNDSCCFGPDQHDFTLEHVADKPVTQQDFESSVRLYEARVRTSLATLGAGSFRTFFDRPSDHTISDHTIQSVIRPALNGNALAPILQYLNE